MFISIIFDEEYMGIPSRKMWYLKNILHCKGNNNIIITHEYLFQHFEELQDSISERFFEEFEMRKFSWDEIKSVEQYYIPDCVFEDIERSAGSRTEMIYQLSMNDDNPLTLQLQKIIDTIKINHPNEKIEGVYHNLESWKCIQSVCEANKIPLIAYSFSAFRKPHGYKQTLYHVNLRERMHSTNECKSRFLSYRNEQNKQFPILNNQEIIALFGKTRTLHLLPLINSKPIYEIGLCTECFSVIPQFFIHDKTTDDDVRYQCSKIYPHDQISVRNHAAQIDFMQLDRSTVHNDPAAWILSCKRIAIARSQILLKALLWKRTAIVKPDTLGFSFLCEKDYKSIEIANIEALNFYLFAYLIPNNLMYSNDYWRWRLSNPSETEIYQRHLDFYSKELGIDWNMVNSLNGNARLEYLLEQRGCDKDVIDEVCRKPLDYLVDYNTATSRFDINGQSHWRINRLNGNIRQCSIELNEGAELITFYPLDDVAGCARILNVKVNGEDVQGIGSNTFAYMPKTKGYYNIPVTADSKLSVEIQWEYQSVQDFLNEHSNI